MTKKVRDELQYEYNELFADNAYTTYRRALDMDKVKKIEYIYGCYGLEMRKKKI